MKFYVRCIHEDNPKKFTIGITRKEVCDEGKKSQVKYDELLIILSRMVLPVFEAALTRPSFVCYTIHTLFSYSIFLFLGFCSFLPDYFHIQLLLLLLCFVLSNALLSMHFSIYKNCIKNVSWLANDEARLPQ